MNGQKQWQVAIGKVQDGNGDKGPYKFQEYGLYIGDAEFPQGSARYYINERNKVLPVGRYALDLSEALYWSTKKRHLEIGLKPDVLTSLRPAQAKVG